MVDVSLIFSPSNGVLGHASHYQNILIIWINLQQNRAVFTKQLKNKVDMNKGEVRGPQSPVSTHLISLRHLVQREPGALLVNKESGHHEPLVPVV